MRIWQRYLFSRLFWTFLLFLSTILGLYIAVDFSMHGARFLSKDTTSVLAIAFNYLRHFAKFGNLFISLSFLLAILRVLLDLTAHREITALQTSGLSTKKLLSPFFLFAALLAAISYANLEWIAPDAREGADDFYKSYSTRNRAAQKVYSLVLQDGSELVYQKYDPSLKQLFDVFWIRSFDEIWHLKTLLVESKTGRFVDRFERKKGALEKTFSADTKQFPNLPLDLSVSFQRFIPLENRPLSTLMAQALGNSSDKLKSAAHLHYKLAWPLIPLITILALAPFAISYKRGRSQILFFGCSIFGYIGLLTMLDAMLILAENRVLPAAAAIWCPLAALTLIFVLAERIKTC